MGRGYTWENLKLERERERESNSFHRSVVSDSL